MIVDCIADLHGHYPKLDGGDLLIVAGDLTGSDIMVQYLEFNKWLANQKYKRKIVIAGNHDNLCLEGVPIDVRDRKGETVLSSFVPVLADDAIYLCDSGTEFEGFKIWGSPWTNTFVGINPHCTAFTGTEELLATKFALIPSDTDILITHGPPYCILDTVRKRHNDKWESVGSVSLLKELDRIRPKLHVYGHIHEGYGQYRPMLDLGPHIEPLPGFPIFVNCSHMNEDYEPVNKPIRVIL